MRKGYIQVYTGDGKGKTTAALGQGMRAVGRGLKVLMIQFTKGTFTGELATIKLLMPLFQLHRFGEMERFFCQLDEDEKRKLKEEINKGYEQTLKWMLSGEYDVIILDEIMAAINNQLLMVNQVCKLLEQKPDNVELILTGRNAPKEILERADLITEMKPIKHYFKEGVAAREGIEY